MNELSVVERTEATIPVLTRWLGSWQVSVQRRAFSAAELGRRYDDVAPRWDRLLALLGVPAAYERLFRRVLDETGLDMHRGRHRVLDCGVGTGAASAALLAALGGAQSAVGLELDAVDVSPRMLERAGTNLHRACLDVTLHRGDVCELPFGDGIFDLAIAAHTLEHVARPDMALREIVRVLKPGGRAVACLTRRSVLGTIVHLKHRTHRVTETEARGWLLDSGFEEVRSLPFGGRALCNRLSVACVGRKPRSKDVPSGRYECAGGDGSFAATTSNRSSKGAADGFQRSETVS